MHLLFILIFLLCISYPFITLLSYNILTLYPTFIFPLFALFLPVCPFRTIFILNFF